MRLRAGTFCVAVLAWTALTAGVVELPLAADAEIARARDSYSSVPMVEVVATATAEGAAETTTWVMEVACAGAAGAPLEVAVALVLAAGAMAASPLLTIASLRRCSDGVRRRALGRLTA